MKRSLSKGTDVKQCYRIATCTNICVSLVSDIFKYSNLYDVCRMTDLNECSMNARELRRLCSNKAICFTWLNPRHSSHPGLISLYSVCHNNKLKCLKGASENKSEGCCSSLFIMLKENFLLHRYQSSQKLYFCWRFFWWPVFLYLCRSVLAFLFYTIKKTTTDSQFHVHLSMINKV